MYSIQPYSEQQAKRLNVFISPSTNPKKKLDVIKGGKKVASIGATGYSDYPTFLKTESKAVAEERRRLYHIRHKKDASKVGSPGYYSARILW